VSPAGGGVLPGGAGEVGGASAGVGGASGGAGSAPGPAGGTPSRAGRELAAACALTLAGALVVLLAGGQRWVPAHLADPTTGSRLAPAAHALALVALAGVVALLAARRWGRIVVGAALVVTGVVIASVAVPRLGTAGVLWPALTRLGGLLVLAAGALTVFRGRTWPALGARYDAPAARPTDADAWAALDRGEDPTAG